ncbi:DUF2634 domain-containing protein [Bacillus sp. AFS017336]|uniref:DUF2634 domain-containing protein n=1 Tax=Bacillus sp. AFS017336 TaxID=2033489 RepID=UPI000BF0236E|nr:DUF2634 domain-containing protein [Bacillus sp. AFS017336]PEL12661.1 hypothetical protein CN601_06855 [Bacillus sp. AFS017336]
MSIFPFVDDTENIISTEELPLYKEWAWDFDLNDFKLNNGKPYLVEGEEAIKIWAYKALITERFKYTVYSWDYGSELNSLIGSGFSNEAVEIETERMIKEALLVNPYITDITDTSITAEDDVVNISFTLGTIYGDTEVSLVAT